VTGDRTDSCRGAFCPLWRGRPPRGSAWWMSSRILLAIVLPWSTSLVACVRHRDAAAMAAVPRCRHFGGR